MKKIITLAMCLIGMSVLAQTQYKEINSQRLGAKRQLKIQLPRNYDPSSDKEYPVVFVFDGDYLFEPVAGAVDYLSYWENMPDALVVGINQNGDRDYDTHYDDRQFLPAEEGAAFFEFVGMELFPWLHEHYNITDFSVAVGHDLTANFAQFYLLKDNVLFDGFVSLSPDLSHHMPERLHQVLSSVEKDTFFYLATGSEDIGFLREGALRLNQLLQGNENPYFHYYFDDFQGANHYSLAGRAVSKAFEQFFEVYQPISKKEFDDVITKMDDSAYEYLVAKYEKIEQYFGQEKQMRVNDFIAIATAIERKQDWESMELLGKLARKQYPDTMLGNYYLALAMEGMGEPKKALRTYENSFVLQEIGNVSKDLVLEKAERIKQDMGY